MPLPLGHTAIGLVIHDFTARREKGSPKWDWKTILLIILLANLPDIDMVVGLILAGNADLFHRGPSHSLLFALGAAAIGWQVSKRSDRLPVMGFKSFFLIILSHIIADSLLTAAPVSFFWPFGYQGTGGYLGWSDVVYLAVFKAFQDAGLIAACGAIAVIRRLTRNFGISAPAALRRVSKVVPQPFTGGRLFRRCRLRADCHGENIV